MKILEVGMGPCLGGIEVYFHNYYKYFSNEFHFDFTDYEGGLYFSDEYIADGCKMHHMPDLKRNPIKYFFALRKILKDERYDIIHINMLSAANILPVIAGLLSSARVIVHSHNAGTPSGKARKILHAINKPMLALADKRLACSELAGKWMFGNKSFTVIPNAIDVSKFSFNETKRKEIRGRYNIGDKHLIGHVGRFSEQKNHRFLIDVFSELCHQSDDYILMLVGEGELMDEIRQLVSNAGLSDKVIFTGSVNNVQDYMSAMDLFVLPSLFEGLGIVGIEAQACGLPCVFSTGVPKEAKQTENVEFVSLEDKEKWIESVERMVLLPRLFNTEKIKKAGYDITDATEIFEKLLSIT